MQAEDVGMMRDGNETRKGDWMETRWGIRFFPLDPRPEEVLLEDVAHHLARVNRYCGAIKLDQYSVAEHSAAMAEYFLRAFPNEPELALQALVHDAPEAYIGDMVRPLKRNMPGFVAAETVVWRACAAAFGVPLELDARVHEADNRILVDEREQVMSRSGNPSGIDHLEPLGVDLYGLTPRMAQAKFLRVMERIQSKL